jgi:hypothetical protein
MTAVASPTENDVYELLSVEDVVQFSYKDDQEIIHQLDQTFNTMDPVAIPSLSYKVSFARAKNFRVVV